ncbi:MAG TPA: hypothetical protein VK002_08920 [Rubricoccaceae bacterium]|nr:hypothetical protein [Rubricoccaceae bacterium]
MKKILTLAACAALLTGCDFVGSDVEPAAFSNLILTDSPLPRDEDGSRPDIYVEIQDVGGRAVVKADQVFEDAEATSFPLTVAGSGALVGTARSYYVVVMDRDEDGSYDLIGISKPFTAEALRTSTEPVFEVTNEQGNLRAELTLAR